MAESVFAMRLVNLRSVICYTDQNFKENAHFGILNLFTWKKAWNKVIRRLSMEKNSVRNLQYGPKSRLIRGMYDLSNVKMFQRITYFISFVFDPKTFILLKDTKNTGLLINSLKQKKLIFNFSVNRNWNKLTDSRKSHHPIETLIYLNIPSRAALKHGIRFGVRTV